VRNPSCAVRGGRSGRRIRTIEHLYTRTIIGFSVPKLPRPQHSVNEFTKSRLNSSQKVVSGTSWCVPGLGLPPNSSCRSLLPVLRASTRPVDQPKKGYDNDSCKNGSFALFGASQREMPVIGLRERSPCSLFHKVGWFSRLWSARTPIRASDAREIPCTRSALRLDHGVLLAKASVACQRSRLFWHVGA